MKVNKIIILFVLTTLSNFISTNENNNVDKIQFLEIKRCSLIGSDCNDKTDCCENLYCGNGICKN
jgi:hypothetical protein